MNAQVVALFEVSRIIAVFLNVCVVVLIDEIDGLCGEGGSGPTSSVRLVQQFQTSFSKYGSNSLLSLANPTSTIQR